MTRDRMGRKDMTTYVGACFCEAVRLEVSGEPEGMGYCYCRSCRSWSGGPVNAFTLWKPDAVRITAGAEHVGMFQKTPVPASILREMWWPFDGKSPATWIGGCLCGYAADPEI